MIHPRLHALDLNLLLALDVLLEERNVTRAAERSGVSQPAMSQALARLRRTFGDPLLIRAGHRMEPTALADGLADSLHALLSDLERLINDRGSFEPHTSGRVFRIACLDHFSALHLPRMAASIQHEAPDVDIAVSQLSYDTVDAELETGAVDTAIGVFRHLPKGHHQQRLHEERFQCLLRAQHPALANWSLETYLEQSHGLLATTGRGDGVVDTVLANRGMARRVAVRFPHFLAAGQLVESTDLIVTMASRLADSLVQRYDVVAVDPPVKLSPFTITLQWHRRTDSDVGHRWLRRQIIKAC